MTTTTDLQKPEREFIDIGAGYEVATVGQGSTFRIHGPNDEMVIVSPTFYHPFYTTMARAIKAERDTLAARVLELEAENRRLREGLVVADKLFAHAIGLPQDEQHLWLFSEEGMDAWQIVRAAIHHFEHEPLSDIARAALKGGEI